MKWQKDNEALKLQMNETLTLNMNEEVKKVTKPSPQSEFMKKDQNHNKSSKKEEEELQKTQTKI